MSVSIREVFAGHCPLNEEITIKGWVRTRRDSKAGLSFLHIHDGSCFAPLQVVANNDLANYQGEIQSLTAGCSVVCRGTLVESQGRGQSFEIHATSVDVVGWVENPDSYPVSAKRHTYEHLREYQHLRVRTNTIGAVTRLRHIVSNAIHRFYDEQGFFWVHTPIITANDCEGAGELFRVSTLDLMNLPKSDADSIDFSQDFFGEETYLTVSGQLNVESYCLAMSKVYTFGPTFRAENSNTSRHLAEFWMVEPEIAFADLDDNASLAEAFLKAIFTEVLDRAGDDMAFFAERVDSEAINRLEGVINSEFVRMDYSEAIATLERSKQKFEYPVSWGIDLQSEHERYLSETHIGGPVIVTNYPKDIKAFYMRMNDDGRTVAAMDVLAPGIGEIIGGSQREERLDVLDARLAPLGLQDQLWWYRDLRRYGTVPHAGFGLGLERVLNYITGLQNIREVIPFPRTPRNAPF
ncbi:MAG: asparagine--tRNA ligase [Gammaproteobacteria bacterium]|nr:asparagine--tRNA ligase [Gammaproteobacteria bacterium]